MRAGQHGDPSDLDRPKRSDLVDTAGSSTRVGSYRNRTPNTSTSRTMACNNMALAGELPAATEADSEETRACHSGANDSRRYTTSSDMTNNESHRAHTAEGAEALTGTFDRKKEKKKATSTIEMAQEAQEAQTTQSAQLAQPAQTAQTARKDVVLQQVDEAEEAVRRDQQYRSLYARLHDALHPDGTGVEEEDLKQYLPAPKVDKSGSKASCVINFATFCARVNRSPEHVAAFIDAEQGTTSTLDAEQRLRVKWATPQKIQQLYRRYLLAYVSCNACKSLSTSMVRDPSSRLQFLRCHTCRSEHRVAPIERGFLAVGRGDRRAARAGVRTACTSVAAGAVAGVTTTSCESALGMADGGEGATAYGERTEASAARPTNGVEGDALIDEKQATLNVGIIGHVAHGKSSIVRGLTGVKTQKHKQEQERNITIRLGYANCKIFECIDDDCLPERRFLTKPSSYAHATLTDRGRCYKLARQVSFVDCPGHESLMQNMLSGAAVMDAALLLVAANEPCPAPQTMEHLAAAECLNLQNVLAVQNKLDLVSTSEAESHYEQVKGFIAGTTAASRAVIPVCAQLGLNLDAVCAELASLPPRPRQTDQPVRMHLIRSFDVNRPGTEPKAMLGGVVGGAISQGALHLEDEVEIRPGVFSRTASGEVMCRPLRTRVQALHSERTPLTTAFPGGLIGVGTRLDPHLTKDDRLKGQVLGAVGHLPPVYNELVIKPTLMPRVVASSMSSGGTSSGGEPAEESGCKTEKTSRLKPKEKVLASVGASSCTATVTKKEPDGRVRIALEHPVCAAIGDSIALSRQVDNKWRLIGRGDIEDGVEVQPLPPLFDEDEAELLAAALSADQSSSTPLPPALHGVGGEAALSADQPSSTPSPPALHGVGEEAVDEEEVAPSGGVMAFDEERGLYVEAHRAVLGAPLAGSYRCRMHERELPVVDEVVIAQVSRVDEGVGVYVSLLQYNNATAFIPGDELTKVRKGRRGASLSSLTREGKVEVCTVLRVDEASRFIDLSKWRVGSEEAAAAELSFKRSKAVHAVIRCVAVAHHISMEELYMATAWPLASKLRCHPYEAFCLASTEPKRIFNDQLTPQLSASLRDALLITIGKRLRPPEAKIKVKADVLICCRGRTGVDAIRAALGSALSLGSEQLPIQVKLVAPPHHTITVSCTEAATGVELLQRAITAAAEEVKRHAGGALNVKEAPCATDESDAHKGAASLVARLALTGGEENGGAEMEVL